MILEFKCSNHRSIKEEVTFSMSASTDTSMEDNVIDIPGGGRWLRSAVIYGPNGSGKSSFIDAVGFMQSMVVRSIMHQPGQTLVQKSHKLSDYDAPSEYEIQFTTNGLRYEYGFSMVRGLIKKEHLYCFPNSKRTVVFEREDIEIMPGSKYKGAFGLCRQALKDNRLFLSCAANYSNINEVVEAYRFFATELVINANGRNNWTNYSLTMMRSDPELKDMFVEFMKMFGTGLTGVEIEPERDQFGNADQEVVFDQTRNTASGIRRESLETKIQYGDFDVNLKEESDGIWRLFELVCPIIDILRGDKVMICDELERSLHEAVVCQIVRLFQKGNPDGNPDQHAQLIFTTHNTGLLDRDLFRRDQIWFTELGEGRATRLYPLTDVKDVRKTENKSKQYLSGKYGAVPELVKDVTETVKEIQNIMGGKNGFEQQ